MRTWEEFTQRNNLTNTEFTAIYYGLKEQEILEEFLEEWHPRWAITSSNIESMLSVCLLWSNTKRGFDFWSEAHAKFQHNFKRYLEINTKKPSIFRSGIKETE
jgi:hypothetical protein